ncbi:uncharacterized protein [Chironomus tepperi]|uniref:uncharacterized protein n=1 Tax=Chironomus tepperi TaxID=113505 RepID=UPI00391F2015
MDILPSDVLLEIFEYFGKDDLMCVLKVCKRWRNLVTRTSKLISQVEIFIRPSNIDTLLTEHADIPYRNLMVHTHLTSNQHQVLDFDIKLAQLVTNYSNSAEFSEIVFFDTKVLFSFVEPLHNLTHLNLITGLPEQQDTIDAINPQICLPKLKILGIKGATWLLRHFKQHSIEVLKIIDTDSDDVNLNVSNFLTACDKLREIKFMGFVPHIHNVESLKLKLTSLCVLLKGQSETSSDSLLQLVKANHETLQELRIIGFNTVDFIPFAINSMNLIKFEVDLCRIRSHLVPMYMNRSIKRMMLQTIALSMKQMQKIIENCESVEELKIISNSNLMFSNWIFEVAVRMKNLRILYLDSLLGIVLPHDLNFKNLETLTVTKLGGEVQVLGWVQLASHCPNVKKLVVTSWGHQFMPMCSLTRQKAPELTYLRKNNLNFILVSLPYLEEIEIRGKFPMTDEILDALVDSQSYSKLKIFAFESTVTDDLMEKLKRFDKTRLKCKVLSSSDVKKTVKRKCSDSCR